MLPRHMLTCAPRVTSHLSSSVTLVSTSTLSRRANVIAVWADECRASVFFDLIAVPLPGS